MTGEYRTMNTCSKIIKIFQIIDAVDTIDLITDFEKDNFVLQNTLGELCFDDELSLEDIKIPQKPLRDLTNPIEMFSKEEFKLRYSFSKELVLYIMELINHGLERPSNRGKPVPPLIELLITLKFMTTGTFQSMTDDIHGVSQPTISRLILKVSSLLSELRHTFIKYQSPFEARRIAAKFYGGSSKFPGVIGCLGATHVGIKNPGGQISEAYLNEHGYYSLKVQVVCGPDLEFLDFVARWPGSTHESKIFNISDLKRRLDSNELNGVLLANSSYPQMKHILTPLVNPLPPQTDAEKKYNLSHSNAYNIPRAIELWKRRFKCLTSVLANKEETTRSIIHASAVLHNIALKHCEKLPEGHLADPVLEPKGKEIKRVFPLDKPLNPDPEAVAFRQQFLRQHF